MTTTVTNTILDRIVADKRVELAALLAAQPLAAVKARALASAPPHPFASRLIGPELRLIAEIKKASPAKGLLEAEMDPVGRARTYASGGAAAISILTETRSFLGSLTYLSAIRAALNAECGDARPALLRKDFLFDPYHLYEARAVGADAILLIAAILPDALLVELLALAGELGLGVLTEVHDEGELERVLKTDARVIGINNRDLHTFYTDLAVTERLVPKIPAGRIVVSESGLQTRADALRVRGFGVDAVLVGEALMTTSDISARMQEFLVR